MIRYLAALLLAAGTPATHAASIDLDDADLVIGKHTILTVGTSTDIAAGWAVTARYFPNSVVEETQTIGTTDSAGSIGWTPQHAGIVQLSASRGEETIGRSASVRFESLPGGAALVFIFAGTIRLGGAGWALVRLFEHDPAHGLH